MITDLDNSDEEVDIIVVSVFFLDGYWLTRHGVIGGEPVYSPPMPTRTMAERWLELELGQLKESYGTTPFTIERIDTGPRKPPKKAA